MPRAVAINVGANTSLPGVRAPVHPDGSFAYVPIPEREPVDDPVPTYADLDVPVEVPEEYADAPVHLDPEFAEYDCCARYTYGDEHGVKARPLLELAAGDVVAFYATLETAEHGAGDPEPPCGWCDPLSEPGDPVADWRPPTWGAYVIGAFRLARDPVSGGEYADLDDATRDRLANNAHVKREVVDAEVFLVGEPERSGLLDSAVPLSRPTGGSDANALVTELSGDSGAGPWWRRPLRFDADASERLLEVLGDPVVDAGSAARREID